MSEPIWIGHEDDPNEEGERDVSGMEQLRAGDIGFCDISGLAGGAIWLGQKIVDATSEEESRFKHVFVVVSNGPPWTGDKYGSGADVQSNFRRRGPEPTIRIVQAMPRGAECVEIGPEHWTSHFVYIRPHYKVGRDGYEDVSERVAQAAMNYVGTPYSFLDYAAIAGLHAGIKNGPIRRYVKSSKHMICSQLADQAMSDAGWHIFDDGRLPQDVTPAALRRGMMTMPGQFITGGTNVWRPTPVDK